SIAMFGGDIGVPTRTDSANGKERWSRGLNSGSNDGASEAIVGDLDLCRPRRKVGRNENIQLRGAHELDVSSFAVHGYADSVELCGKLFVDKIRRRPSAGSRG